MTGYSDLANNPVWLRILIFENAEHNIILIILINNKITTYANILNAT